MNETERAENAIAEAVRGYMRCRYALIQRGYMEGDNYLKEIDDRVEALCKMKTLKDYEDQSFPTYEIKKV